MAKKTEKLDSVISARGSDGQLYKIHHYRVFLEHATELDGTVPVTEGIGRYVLDDGRTVNRLGDGRFEILNPSRIELTAE